MIFSRKPAGMVLKKLTHDYFLKHNIIIINLCDNDFKRIIYDNANFLEVIQEKIQTIKHNITTKPEVHKLYR